MLFGPDCGDTHGCSQDQVGRFKPEMRAGFRFEPGRFGRNENPNEESLLPSVPFQERARALSGHDLDPSTDGWPRFKRARRNSDGPVRLEGEEETPADPELGGAGSLSHGHLNLTRKRPVKFSIGDGGEWDQRSGSSRTRPFAGVNGVSRDEVCTSTDSEESEERTCRRARVYLGGKGTSSCARTDVPRPFLKRGSRSAPLAHPPPPVSSSIGANQRGAPSGCSPEERPSGSRVPSSGSRWTSPPEGEGRDGFLTGGNDWLAGETSKPSPDSTKIGFTPQGAGTSPPFSGPEVVVGQSPADINSPLSHSGREWCCSGTSPSPSAVALLSDVEGTSSLASASPPPSFQPRGGASLPLDGGASSPCSSTKSSGRRLWVSEGAPMSPCSRSSAPAHSCDSFHSCESSLLLPQDRREREPLPHSKGSPTDDESYVVCSSSLLSWSPESSERKEEEEEEEEEEEDTSRPQTPQRLRGSSVDVQLGFEGSGEAWKPAPLTKPASSPSSQEGPEPSSPSTCPDVSRDALDEVTAYERDILLVDVTQDDAELFENPPQKSLLKLGPVTFSEKPRSRPPGTAAKQLGQRSTPGFSKYNYDSADDAEESNKRPWRPRSRSRSPIMQSSAWSPNETDQDFTALPDENNNNNNQANRSSKRSQPIKPSSPPHSHNPAALGRKTGPVVKHSANSSEFRRQKSNAYCWKYFSDFTTCGYQTCRFQHVPVEGDEKFCFETISRFTKNPMCLHKAHAVFTSYYLHNPPGGFFSMPIFLSLLWALLKAGMVSDVLSILNVSITHKIAPGHEFVLALFNVVRGKGHSSLLPELMQLTFKMASAGLVLSFDWMDGLPNNGKVPPAVCANSSSTPSQGSLNVAHAVVEIQLCTKVEDWRRLGEVFASVLQSIQHPNQLQQISGRVAIALLSDSKDKQAVPFAAFAETVFQKNRDDVAKTYIGRIGVSLMLRHHKTQQWAKGRRVAEVMSCSKINYSTMMGLFGNENRASRCFLVTVATELFLLSGSIEGALNTLRENSWFLSSSLWPCAAADLEGRTRVLLRLAEQASHRATLEILRNLPGLKEPSDLVNVSNYSSVFNAHLLLCVDRQALPAASDLADFMLAKQLPVEASSLQRLLLKLGKQNQWLRARELFRHSLGQGYYQGVSAPPGFMALMVPCRLEEVELALAFEMFLTVNCSIILHLAENTSRSLSITLKRTQSSESEYLSAGSRLLSAASIPQPKLIIHYRAVNSTQEQVFDVDVSSARSWLRHNHLWANEVWAH